VFDGAESAIASCLGFIYSQRDASEYDPKKAADYYSVAAGSGDSYAQYALGGLLMELGDTEKALDWYGKASEAGVSACSYKLYLTYRSRGDERNAERYLDRAIEQGNPAAIQQLAIRHLTGANGIIGIP
jgi:TPR repeat protein